MPTSWEQWAALATIAGAVSGAIIVLARSRSAAVTRKAVVLAYLREASAYIGAAHEWIFAFFGPPYYGGTFHFKGGHPRESAPPTPTNAPAADFDDDVIREKLVGARACVEDARGLLDQAARGLPYVNYESREYERRAEEIRRRFSEAASGCRGRYSCLVCVTDDDVRKAIQPWHQPAPVRERKR